MQTVFRFLVKVNVQGGLYGQGLTGADKDVTFRYNKLLYQEVCMSELRFYYEYEENGFLSNYWLVNITLEGKDWPSVEHYYQAHKTLDKAFAERIRSCGTCDEAKTLGNSPECIRRADWDEVKDTVMMQAITAKFTQHADLGIKLIATGDAVLEENSTKDYYWGIGADGTGKSMLGHLLMNLREQLKG